MPSGMKRADTSAASGLASHPVTRIEKAVMPALLLLPASCVLSISGRRTFMLVEPASTTQVVSSTRPVKLMTPPCGPAANAPEQAMLPAMARVRTNEENCMISSRDKGWILVVP
ncbi:hypothetical protein D9M72_533490 [compost metagenome]